MGTIKSVKPPVYLTARGLKPVAELASTREHGDRLKYLAGCRCADCRRANSAYESARQKARKAGDFNGIVPAAKARAHLLMLSKQGVGRRAVGATTDISDTVLSDIRSGNKKNIRARTERLILAVNKDMASDHALTSATGTWKLIYKLLDKGYSEAQLAKLLGYANPVLQFGKEQVLAITACEIRRLYQKLEATGFTDAKQKAPTGTYSPRPGVIVHRMGA